MKIDLSGVQSQGFEPIPAGNYHVKFTDGEIKESGPNAKNPGAEYFNLECTVQDGPHEDRKLWVMASLLPHALFTLKNIAESLDMGDELDKETFIEEIVGRDVIAVVKIRPATEEYEAKNEIKKFKKYDGSKSDSSGSLLP
jgi:hypothetical protein